MEQVEFSPKDLADIAAMAEMFHIMPHEWAAAERDVPGVEIPYAHLIFDIQCASALSDRRSKEMEQARRKAKHHGR